MPFLGTALLTICCCNKPLAWSKQFQDYFLNSHMLLVSTWFPLYFLFFSTCYVMEALLSHQCWQSPQFRGTFTSWNWCCEMFHQPLISVDFLVLCGTGWYFYLFYFYLSLVHLYLTFCVYCSHLPQLVCKLFESVHDGCTHRIAYKISTE